MSQGSRSLYTLLSLKVGQEVSVEAFCNEFEHAYNFEVAAEDLTDQEEHVFRELFNIVVWYSSSFEERAEYPKHFKGETEIIDAIVHARRELGLPPHG